MAKTIAQICKECHNITVLPERIETCRACDAAMPVPKPKPKPKAGSVGLTSEDLKNLWESWQQWKDAEPKPDEIAEPATNDVIAEFLDVQEQVSLLYNLVYGFLSKNNELIKSKEIKTETLCDFGFFSREIAKVFDELRKEAQARQELTGAIIAARKTQESINDPTISLNVNGQYSTGIPDVKMQAQLPKKYTDEYFQLTDFFGIDRETAAAGVIRIDWKGSGEYLTKLAQEGKPVPEGFGKKYPTYVTTFRKKRKIK